MHTQNLNPLLPMERNGYLFLLNGESPRSFEIKDYLILGRDPQSQVIINDGFASTRHARIERRANGYFIIDLGSRNGTYVNQHRVLSAPLKDYDRIQIGRSEFIFTHDNKLESSMALMMSKNADWNVELRRLPAVAANKNSVLIMGPSGSGKEVLAHLIHKNSPRRHGPFLTLNCSALTDTLAESELFGHRRGSFTGANTDRKGIFEAARGGTLFLDEIGDMPMHLQPKLLRTLENNEIRPVGSDETLPIDVRIVAATNKDLRQLCSEEKFREDLYFRLHILKIHPPPLKDRMEDFEDLLRLFSRPLRVRWTAGAMLELRKYEWPGNIRELKNMVQRAAALFPDQVIDEAQMHDLIDSAPAESVSPPPDRMTPSHARQLLADYEKQSIIDSLKVYRGNQRKTAKELGLAKSTLHDRIKRYGIDAEIYRWPSC